MELKSIFLSIMFYGGGILCLVNNNSIQSSSIAKSLTGQVENKKLLLSVKPDTFKLPLTATEHTFITITNNTNMHYSYGGYYRIEFYDNEKWIQPKLKEQHGLFATEAFLYHIGPHTTKEHWFNLRTDTYDYKPGKYRIVQSFTSAKENTRIEVYAGFLIEK